MIWYYIVFYYIISHETRLYYYIIFWYILLHSILSYDMIWYHTISSCFISCYIKLNYIVLTICAIWGGSNRLFVPHRHQLRFPSCLGQSEHNYPRVLLQFNYFSPWSSRIRGLFLKHRKKLGKTQPFCGGGSSQVNVKPQKRVARQMRVSDLGSMPTCNARRISRLLHSCS